MGLAREAGPYTRGPPAVERVLPQHVRLLAHTRRVSSHCSTMHVALSNCYARGTEPATPRLMENPRRGSASAPREHNYRFFGSLRFTIRTCRCKIRGYTFCTTR